MWSDCSRPESGKRRRIPSRWGHEAVNSAKRSDSADNAPRPASTLDAGPRSISGHNCGGVCDCSPVNV